MTLSLSIHDERCTAAGQCILAAPNVFDQNDNGTIKVIDPDPPESERPAVEDAVRRCPARVIELVGD